jgi:hypothetical protein
MFARVSIQAKVIITFGDLPDDSSMKDIMQAVLEVEQKLNGLGMIPLNGEKRAAIRIHMDGSTARLTV